jgi:probable H4MPT-linked C1 transfer pathway protein
MSGEMVDLFGNREQGVHRIAAQLAQTLAEPLRFFAGDQGWCTAAEAGAQWRQIASANWLATARHVAQWAEGRCRAGVLVDVGSTTTDLVAFRGGRLLSTSGSDAQRLARGELVYQGVVRTPLCALAQRVALQGTVFNVMNEFFASTADVYRLTAELNPAHDMHPSADGAAKDRVATHQRLARMVGLDAGDASATDWLAFARAWRAAQVAEIVGQLRRVLAAFELPADATLVAAGCGAFLVPDLLAAAGLVPAAQVLDYGIDVAPMATDAPADATAWARVCAPSVAVAALFDQEPH